MSDFWAEIVETAKSVIRRWRKKFAIWQSYGSGQKTFDEVGIQGRPVCARVGTRAEWNVGCRDSRAEGAAESGGTFG